jgi:hypothetical protein
MSTINYNNDNTIIFTLARMNPPTPGHLYVIRRLIDTAIERDVDHVYVILSKTNDNNENPIPCNEKINVLGDANDLTKTMIHSEKQRMIDESSTDTERKQKIEEMKVIAICVPEQKGATPFTPLFSIAGEKRDVPDLNLILVIGDDRRNMLDSITDFFFKWDNVKSVDGIILPREEMTEYKRLTSDPSELDKLNMSDVPINAMSASFVRNIVKNKRRDKFMELYSPFLDENKIPELYESVLRGLTLPPNKKPDSPAPPLKYRYPMVKGVSEISNGVNKRSASETNSTKTKTRKTMSSVNGGKKRTNRYKKTSKKYYSKKRNQRRRSRMR